MVCVDPDGAGTMPWQISEPPVNLLMTQTLISSLQLSKQTNSEVSLFNQYLIKTAGVLQLASNRDPIICH